MSYFLSGRKNDMACHPQYHVPIVLNFDDSWHGLIITALRAAVWSMIEEHTTCPGQNRQKHHIYRENRIWCFDRSWEWKSESPLQVLSGQICP